MPTSSKLGLNGNLLSASCDNEQINMHSSKAGASAPTIADTHDVSRHPLLMTFLDPSVEARYLLWQSRQKPKLRTGYLYILAYPVALLPLLLISQTAGW
ncbi:hypothetical protein WJX72_008771 [[Myrmecia] bisecta]|uniref:Uncharacterized protein n=1 Tax=[Myrmecia] bisecta TaxID=41462 RepID=A0AAW1PYF1_9CHLO